MVPSQIPPTRSQRLLERVRPEGPVVMLQRWEQLLFLHWRYDVATVQATLPPGLTVDPWQGSAWVGLVPLFMRDVRPRFVPAIAQLSDFLELNLRTYVFDAAGRPGIYFYSLDCDQPVAVEAARRLLHLRYEHCEMTARVDAEGWVDMAAERIGTNARSVFRYRADGPAAEAATDSLEFFLLERYRLFTTDREGEQMHTVRVGHAPYRIRAAEVSAWGDAPLWLAGLAVPGRAPEHACTAEAVNVDVFAPEKVT